MVLCYLQYSWLSFFSHQTSVFSEISLRSCTSLTLKKSRWSLKVRDLTKQSSPPYRWFNLTLFKDFWFTIILTISIPKIFFFSFYFSYFFQFFSFLSSNCFWIHFFKLVCLIFIFAFLLKGCTLGSETTFNNWKPFTNDEKMLFYFTLKGLLLLNIFLFNIIFSIFFSIFLYIYFCLDFLVMYKNALIRKIRLLSKFMVSRPGKQTIAIHYCPISQKVKTIRQWTLFS